MTDRKDGGPALEYGFEIHDGETDRKRYVWFLKGPNGGVHIWAQFTDGPVFREKCYGGCEVHYPHKPYDHSPDEAPIKDCWLLGGDCWCDGSSLYFSENIQPMVEDYEDEPEKITEFINAHLYDWYQSYFGRGDK